MSDSTFETSRSGVRGFIRIRRRAGRLTDRETQPSGIARPTTASLHALTVALALLASLIFVLTDADRGRTSASLWFQISGEFAATMGFAWLIRRRMDMKAASSIAVPLLLMIVFASLLWEPLQRWFLLSGRPFEMMVMHSQKNLMLAAAVFGCWAGYQRLSILIGVALAILCATITREYRIQWLVAAYGCATVGWLIASYWDTLRSRLIAGETRRLPSRWLIAGSSIPLLLILTAANGSHDMITVMRGILPGSGGDGDSDPYSRDGVNDGDNLVAGTDNIKSFGPIEDAPFAEDDKPSLYDVFNDSYEEPVRKINDQDRSIALPPDVLADINARLAKSKQSGKEFSTLRRSTQSDKKKIQDLESHALLYVAGRVPLHLRMETYDVFDGVDWIAETKSGEPLGLSITASRGRPWLQVPCGNRSRELFSGSENHAVKVINLRSNVIPTPLHLRALHIDQVDTVSMFGWHSDSILKMERRSLPELTSIQLLSECMDQSRLKDHSELIFPLLPRSQYRQLPEIPTIAPVRVLAKQWTQGIPDGYLKIDAICQHLRANYTLDRTVRVPEDCTVPVSHFLFESKRGPDYQFATAAALMLRSLGFSTRLVSGFYASPERFDIRKGHTAVHASDVHFWCEVFIGAGTWVTLDPTPGYEVLRPRPGLVERVMSLAGDAARWMFRHWMIVLVVFAAASAAFVQRRLIADRWNTVMWQVAPSATPRGRIRQTVRLLDDRLRLAGQPRPAGVTLTKWLQRQLQLDSAEPVLRDFLHLVDWASYSAQHASPSVSREAIENCCFRIQQNLTLAELQQTAKDCHGLRPSIPLPPSFSEAAYS